MIRPLKVGVFKTTLSKTGRALGTITLAIAALPLQASELIYNPVNPSFGGNPLNGSYLLGTAQAQNDHGAGTGSRFSERSSLDRFASSLESRLLNQLIGDIGEGNSGTLVTQDFVVEILDEDGFLTVLITDLLTNETTEIEVQGLSPN